MHQELDELLCSKYPNIFMPRAKRDQALFGFECGDGWYRLIDAACALIQVETHTSGHQLVASQVKQKFGGLRFYCRGGNHYAASVITLTQALSVHVCELCGFEGKEVILLGCMQIRCPAHEQTTSLDDVIEAATRLQLQTDPVMDQLLGSALEFFSPDVQAAANWLSRPVRALGNIIPLALAGTQEGQLRVMNVLGRLEHGIPQ